jgi:peptide/nickel transport system substrate-binding protein
MYKRYLTALLLIFAVILSACGGATATTQAPSATDALPAVTTAPEATTAPATTSAPTATTASAATSAPTATTAPAATSAPAAKYSQSPMLDALVKAGTLPAVENRLPVDPFVVGPGTLISKTDLPDWQPGVFGGTLRFAHAAANWNPDIFIMLNENLLCAPGIDLVDMQGCIVKDYKADTDNKVFTFTLRKGLKWSDGQPVTTEDVRFTVEDIYGNDKLNPSGVPAKFRDNGSPDGAPMKLTILDDFTFSLTFTQPYGGLLREISVKGWQGYTDLLNPAHVLKAYHIKYTTIDKMAADLKRLNLTNGEWWQVFGDKRCQNWDMTNPKCVGYPSLNPWVGVKNSTAADLSFDRNPYYYKVDTKGQQLPYIDKLYSQSVNDVESLTLKVLAGEVDYVRESTALVKLPLYKQNQDKAGFHVQLMANHVDPTALFLNYTYPDATWKKVVMDLRFRQAVNFAINRAEIISNVYFGLAQQPALVDSTYSVDKANALLDAMGMNKKDAEGYRIGPDGKTFVILLSNGQHAPDITPAVELLVTYFKAVGLKVQAKTIDSTLWGTMSAANQLEAYVLWDVQPMWKNGTWTDYLPGEWGTLWNTWYTTAGKKGEEPPAEIKALYKDNEGRIAAVPLSDQDTALATDIYKNLHDNIWVFPLAEKVNYAMIVSNKLGNIPQTGQAIGADYSGEQFFFKP